MEHYYLMIALNDKLYPIQILNKPNIQEMVQFLKANKFLSFNLSNITKGLKLTCNRLSSVLRLIMISLGISNELSKISDKDKEYWNEFITMLTKYAKSINAGQSIPVVNLKQTASEIAFQYKFLLK